jgi:hypothetical protein
MDEDANILHAHAGAMEAAEFIQWLKASTP